MRVVPFLQIIALAVGLGSPVGIRTSEASDYGTQGCNPYLSQNHSDPLEFASYLLESRIRELRERYHVAGKPLFEGVDDFVRANPKVAVGVLELALRRLPHLRTTPFNVVLSGGAAKAWSETLQAHAESLGLHIHWITIEGGLSANQAREKPAPETAQFSPEDSARIAKAPTLFLDDSYSSGETAFKIAAAVSRAGGTYLGTFVAFARTMGNPVALVRQPIPGPRTFTVPEIETPNRWAWRTKTDLVILNLQWQAYSTPEVFRLIKELRKLGTRVAIPSMTLVVYDFIHEIPPSLIDDSSDGEALIRNLRNLWPNPFTALSAKHKRRTTLTIGPRRSDVPVLDASVILQSRESQGWINSRLASEHWERNRDTPKPSDKPILPIKGPIAETYYLDRLVEQGFLTPIFSE